MDSWSEYFSLERWINAFAQCGVDPDFYAVRERAADEVLPWSRVSMGVRTDFLWHEYEQALQAKLSPDCRVQCTACGAAKLLKGGKCDG